MTDLCFDRVKRQIELENTLETVDPKRTSSCRFSWHNDDQEISVVGTIESCSMHRKLVRIGGYSALPLAFPSTGVIMMSEPESTVVDDLTGVVRTCRIASIVGL